MSKPVRSTVLPAAIAGLLLPVLASAWTPYGPAPTGGEGTPGAGAPFPGYGGGPAWGEPPMNPGMAGPGAPFPGYGPPGAFPQGTLGSTRPGMQISRRTTDDAYVVDIELRNLRPDEVQVKAEGRWLSIGRDTSAQEVRQEQFDQGRGYMRSYSWSSGSSNRRVGLPPDADASGMQREDRENGLTLRIPRTGFAGPQGGEPPRR